tara:strand:+ start:1414 stop:1668 length:255 start_codon:yes stop_codon:yes gene_type:complete
MGLRLMRHLYETIGMDHDQLRMDLEYITQVRDLPAEESLRSVLARLDACAQTPGLHDRLEHYLTKRSYAKALVWLDNPDSPHHP